ncbi:MAG TPA: SapC family protein, partial [Rhodothermales bacterium]|nr:SapC family protein [Rhodothermales bacterium]
EFAAASLSYPIVFVGESKSPLAVMGLRDGENLYITEEGARLTLERLSHFDARAHGALRSFADAVLARTGLDTARIVVTLHNNTEANYSTRSYLPGGEYAADAADVYLSPSADPDDFFFVTERPLFDALKRRGFNVVLQDNARVTDDGSLSVLAARRGQRYVNVEAQHGHRRQQERMIHALLDVLARLN